MKLKDPRNTPAGFLERSLPCENFVASWDQPAWLHKATQTFEIGVALAGRFDPEWQETRIAS